jgi:hypothetical protein
MGTESPSCRLQDYRTGDPGEPDTLLTAARNVRLMHLLERLATVFNDAGVPLMVLKGAALNLTLYDDPGQRPMDDLDLLVRPADVQRATELLLASGSLHGEPLVREDFFPRFHYEREFRAGSIYPTKIDLHVRPFRPLRYSRLIPEHALWDEATEQRIGRAAVLVPSAEDMLLHLAVHSAVHGNCRPTWLQDLRAWIERCGPTLNWDRIIRKAKQWRLALPLRRALQGTDREFPGAVPPRILTALSQIRVSWRDRLALWEAPRDATHPAAHILVDAACTPGLRFTASYLVAALLPDRVHMSDWYGRRHFGWLACAHLARLASPLLKRIPGFTNCLSGVQTGPSAKHGVGIFASRDLRAGQTIASYEPRPASGDGMYVGHREQRAGQVAHYEITGKLKFLNHSCQPNAELVGFELRALRPILVGQEILIDYGERACTCRRPHASREPAVAGAA